MKVRGKYFFCNVGPPQEDIFSDHLLQSIFRSTMHIYFYTLHFLLWASEGSFLLYSPLLRRTSKQIVPFYSEQFYAAKRFYAAFVSKLDSIHRMQRTLYLNLSDTFTFQATTAGQSEASKLKFKTIAQFQRQLNRYQKTLRFV